MLARCKHTAHTLPELVWSSEHAPAQGLLEGGGVGGALGEAERRIWAALFPSSNHSGVIGLVASGKELRWANDLYERKIILAQCKDKETRMV